VTPTKYLDLVKGYRSMLDDKRKEIGELASKLRNGLAKLDQSKEQVSTMSIELEQKKKIVAQKKNDCDKLLVEIVQKQRAADEQKKVVEQDAVRTEEDTKECTKIRGEAQQELDKVIPTLEAAIAALEKLDKKSVTEVKSYTKPPPLVEKVMSAVMTVLKKEPTWAAAKKELGDSQFLNKLKNFDKEKISNATVKQIGKYTKQKDFSPEKITSVSLAAGAMCEWVIAMEQYAMVYRDVEPRRQALHLAEDRLRQKQSDLAQAQAQLKDVTDKIAALESKYQQSETEKNALRKEAENLELKLSRAAQLVDGLSGEKKRWEERVAGYDIDLKNLIGDCAVAAAFISYAGPFPSAFREELVQKKWMPAVSHLNLPLSADFDFGTFLSVPTEVREWNIQGLPSDGFSTENGVMVTRGNRFPLMIDPQGQANKWVKAKEGSNLKVVDASSDSLMRVVEGAIQFGTPVLIQDVGEELDAALEPILRLTRMSGEAVSSIRLGDKELNYSPDFMLYMTTKLGNPHFKPEVCIKTTIVNFAVKEKGLEDQLLGLVVKKEQPKLEEDKSKLVLAVSAGKRRLVELEDEILSLLKNAGPNLLDDELLINALQSSKSTAEEVKQQLKVSEETEEKIDQAREAYRACAVRASIIYFVLNDLGSVDPMYQFSLESYISLFEHSIDASHNVKARSGKSSGPKLAERIRTLNDFHTEAVYDYTCRALFEKHKLLFAFQLCVKKMQSDGALDKEEYDFFLRGGTVLDKNLQPPNPCKDWLPEAAWDHITELEKLPAFQGIVASFDQNSSEWRDWYRSQDPPPEEQRPVGEWHNKWDEFEKMVVLRCLRPDRVAFAVRKFISANLGPHFVAPPPFDLHEVHELSTPTTPVIFVLSAGVDPSPLLQQLATELNHNVDQIALGQGQAPIAEQILENGIINGNWVFLANCHLSVSWLPKLEKLVEAISKRGHEVHPDFRLWLSSDPTPHFPISLLQNSIKLTTEPPKGLKANLARLYANMTEEQFNRSAKPEKYKKLLFALCFFHSVLVERRKFLTLGWNVAYAFNDSDFAVCENILQLYLDEYEDTPWDAIKYLIAEANYGGRVTDAVDRRLLSVYINRFFSDDALKIPKFELSEMKEYYIPEDGNLDTYKKYVASLPSIDPPEAFGQNSNADIASQMQETHTLLDTVLSLQPRIVTEGGSSREDTVLDLTEALLTQIPEELDLKAIQKKLQHDTSPLKTVLVQELARYNQLLAVVRTSVADLQKGLKGLVVISPELEEVFESLFTGKVPEMWKIAYPTTKPLGPWTRDLIERIAQLSKWATEGAPKVFWLSGFTFPTGFLTALLQSTARKNGVPIDNLSWEFTVMQQDEASIQSAPKDGAYIRGLFLENARWNSSDGCLAEPLPMELFSPLPIIHFKPVEARKKGSKGVYSCPLYMYPVRTGTRERPSFMINVDLKSGAHDADFWVKRGTALLLSLSN